MSSFKEIWLFFLLFFSVADPGCSSQILIFTHLGSKNSNKREGWKKFVPFFMLKFEKFEYSCARGAQKNFGDITPYLAFAYS
jgi:hypothetical protein